MPRRSLFDRLHNAGTRYIQKVGGEEIPTPVPPLLDAETHAEILKALAANFKYNPKRGRPHYDYLLSGVIYCGKCGGRWSPRTPSSEGADRYYRHKDLKCCDLIPRPRIRADALEETVVEALTRHYASPGLVHEAMKALKKIETKITNLADAIADGLPKEVWKEKLAALEEERTTWQSEIRTLQAKSVALPTKDECVKMVAKLKAEVKLSNPKRMVKLAFDGEGLGVFITPGENDLYHVDIRAAMIETGTIIHADQDQLDAAGIGWPKTEVPGNKQVQSCGTSTSTTQTIAVVESDAPTLAAK